MKNCDEYVEFVQKTIKEYINQQYSIQGRNIEDITGIYALKKVEAAKELANLLGVEIES